ALWARAWPLSHESVARSESTARARRFLRRQPGGTAGSEVHVDGELVGRRRGLVFLEHVQRSRPGSAGVPEELPTGQPPLATGSAPSLSHGEGRTLPAPSPVDDRDVRQDLYARQRFLAAA